MSSWHLDSRARLLRAALGFLALEPREPELRMLHQCFDTWRGIGDIVVGMARHDFDLELRRFNGRGWRATFLPSGFEHSFTSSAASAFAMSVRGRRSSGRQLIRSLGPVSPTHRRATGRRPTSRQDDRPIVMALGGWKTERMMRRYAAVTDSTLRAAAEAVSGAESAAKSLIAARS